ncbi:phosphatase [Paenibacillus oryzae]|uniref:Phosphatase n=1 Tax=Paenibacillus oryzae TaxID=1844972 RepID=A0A1A5YSC8_9BACL|nr:Ppx/GppA phosphatase family protein [Paenibacillus oryzae]OBR68527.1 phosphatase [Paenibacillus oryzae]
MTGQRIGIIDIGSNSIRLVVYERTVSGAHRVVDGSKRSARLSGKMDAQGCLPDEHIGDLIDTLHHFSLICSHHGVGHIRAVATAAIRNATNSAAILESIKSETGLHIELLSGVQEASYGFLGMINSLRIDEGYLIDIGGGSTEITLFRNRDIVHSVSFPFGCVSLNHRFDSKNGLSEDQLKQLEELVADAIKDHPWIVQHPGLPLVGVGGTARALGKLHQGAVDYPFNSTHNYMIQGEQVDELFHSTRNLPLERRRKLPGLSKDRADVIVPGIAVIRTIFRMAKTTHYRICGAGLRDGLFHSTRFPNKPKLDDPLTYSLKNISSLHTEAPRQHVLQVNRLATELLDALQTHERQNDEAAILLDAASQLYRIGAAIDYYDYATHSFYLILHSHLNGLTHREIIMIAAIASYRSKGKSKNQLAPYRVLLSEDDLELVARFGVLLQLAAALDRSETQSIGRIQVRMAGRQLLLSPVLPRGHLSVERREVEELAQEFKKLWGLEPVLQ